MNVTLAGLLQGCAETPHDSTPHLILADWLEDHDQPERAEFLRVQCRLADWVPDLSEREHLIERQQVLLSDHQARWLGPLQRFCERVDFKRGLAQIWVSSRTFTSGAFGEALQAAPEVRLIEEVRLLRCKSLSRVANRPWLSFVPSLSVAQLDLPGRGIAPLLQSEHTGALLAMDLSGNNLEGRDVAQLLAAPFFPKLHRLGLRNVGLNDAGALSLLRADCPNLHDLDLAGNTLSAQTLELLAERKNPGRVMNALGMEFAQIPAGTFAMGSAQNERGALNDQYPRHNVTLSRSYWMGRFPVTQGQYQAVMSENPSRFNSGSPALPAENIDYLRATEFCRRLSNLPTERKLGRAYRIPTEAEWEHACRAGTFTAYYWGDDPVVHLLNYRGRYDSNEPEQRHPGRTTVVGSYPPNGFGIHEMHGNVWEWTSDWYSQEWYKNSPNVDPVGPDETDADEATRTIRGGCWHAVGICCRSAHRFGEEIDTQDDYTGFRVVMIEGKEPDV